MLVYIINKHGQPLMPCKPQRARKLLKEKKAKVVKRAPFTIQLLYGSSGYKQSVTLGVDAGSKTIGLSATTDKKELFSAEISLRNDIVRLLSDRRTLRRNRRNRKTRYRQVRFLNLKKDKGWLAPSILNRIQCHFKAVEMVHSILPISRIIVEVAQFDIQKIKNPNIEGKGYQQGEQLGFWNIREYVLFRDGHKCQNCNGKSKNPILNVHHIESRKIGGDSPGNLITLCESCHQEHHQGKITLKIKIQASFRDATFMGIMRWAFYNNLKETYPNVNLTYGYQTKSTRIESMLEKSHRVDARCISKKPISRSNIGVVLVQTGQRTESATPQDKSKERYQEG